MKTIMAVFAATAFCGALFSPLWAGEWLTQSQVLAQIRADTADLLQAQKEIRKDQAQISKTRKDLETKMLTQQERSSMRDLIGKDKGMIAAFHDEAMDEIGFMDSHWYDLTQGQRELLSQMETNLG